MNAKLVHLSAPRPKTFTTAEALIEEMRQHIFTDKRRYKELAYRTGVSYNTILNITSGRTRWPRPTTLFPLMDTLGVELQLVKKREK